MAVKEKIGWVIEICQNWSHTIPRYCIRGTKSYYGTFHNKKLEKITNKYYQFVPFFYEIENLLTEYG